MVSLLRKEWQATRTPFLVMSGVGIALMGLSASVRVPDLSIFVWYVVVGLGTNIIGAGLFSSESAEGTLLFLLSVPLHRPAIWTSKVLVGLLELCGLLCLMTLGGFLFWRIASPPPEVRILIMRPLAFSRWLLVLYSSALLCSVLLDRTVTAVLAGYCVFAGILYFIGFITAWELDIEVLFMDWGLSSTLTALGVSALLLLTSLLVFLRKEMR